MVSCPSAGYTGQDSSLARRRRACKHRNDRPKNRHPGRGGPLSTARHRNLANSRSNSKHPLTTARRLTVTSNPDILRYFAGFQSQFAVPAKKISFMGISLLTDLFQSGRLFSQQNREDVQFLHLTICSDYALTSLIFMEEIFQMASNQRNLVKINLSR